MKEGLEEVLQVTERIQKNFSLRREIDGTLDNTLAYVHGNVRATLKAARDELSKDIDRDIEVLEKLKLWSDKLWPSIRDELGLSSPSHKINVARTFFLIHEALKEVFSAPQRGDLILTPPVSGKDETIIMTVLKGNRYMSLDSIYKDARECDQTLQRAYVLEALDKLTRQGKILQKAMFGSGGGHPTWKKPTKKYTKMKKFEWKKMIVDVLDKCNGGQLTHQEITGALKHQYNLGSPPESLHGSVGSALDRLSKDGKLKRFHRRKVKKGYVYWTTPISRPLPLPLPSNR